MVRIKRASIAFAHQSFNPYVTACWTKEIWHKSQQPGDLQPSFVSLRWLPFSGWKASNFAISVTESPTYLPFGGVNAQEFYALTTDNRVFGFSPSQPDQLTSLPIMVCSPTNTLRVISVQCNQKTIKCILFFVCLEGTDLHNKLAATIWSDSFPMWAGPQLLNP